MFTGSADERTSALHGYARDPQAPRWVNSRNCRSERPEDHDRRIEDAGHCHAEEHNQGKDLQGPGGTGAARKLPVCENSCDHGQGKKNQGYQCEKRALHRSRSMAGEEAVFSGPTDAVGGTSSEQDCRGKGTHGSRQGDQHEPHQGDEHPVQMGMASAR